MYRIIDNRGESHYKEFATDTEALNYMRTRYIDYIISVLSTDSIILVRPNGYILAYIATTDGSQTVKSMSDWEIED